MKSYVLLLLLIFGLAPAGSIAADMPPKVVVSIKPIHSLVSAVMEGVTEPKLIIKGSASPHSYVMRPSEARMLSEADLVIWVGEGFETFLSRSLATLGKSAIQLGLADHLQAQMLPVREGGTWEGHDDHEQDHNHKPHDQNLHHHDDDHKKDSHSTLATLDQHIWTSPLLAREIVRLVAEALIEIDPSRQELYTKNADALKGKLDLLYQEVKHQLAPVAMIPYIVFHDGYQYFERDFGVNAIGSVTIDAERSPGVRRIREVRDKINQLQARAVFSEPQFQSRLVTTIIEGSGAKTGVLDPLGADLTEGPQAYFSLIRQLSENLVTTLSAE